MRFRIGNIATGRLAEPPTPELPPVPPTPAVPEVPASAALTGLEPDVIGEALPATGIAAPCDFVQPEEPIAITHSKHTRTSFVMTALSEHSTDDDLESRTFDMNDSAGSPAACRYSG
jgi:hypothetical protein